MSDRFSGQPVRFSRQYWLKILAFLAAVMAMAMTGLAVYLIDRQIDVFLIPVRNTSLGAPDSVRETYQDVTLIADDGLSISGWYFPGTRREGIVLVHGIHANRSAVLPEAGVLADAGYHLLLIDLRGHGLSEDSLATYGYNEAKDVTAAVDYLLALPEVEQVGVLGTSFGGAAVVRAAALDPRIKAVVVESSYASMVDAVEDAFDDMSALPRWPFAPLLIKLSEQRVGVEISQVDSARDLAMLQSQAVFIIHADNDRLFPLYHAEKMYEAAQEPKELWVIEDLGHGNPALGREEEFRERVVPFFETAFAGQ